MKSLIVVAVAGLVILSTSCGGRQPVSQVDSLEHDLRFVGLWRVIVSLRGPHYETIYEFRANGELALVRANSERFETGVVSRCNPAMGDCNPTVNCRFGENWHSDGPDKLLITGVCDDGAPREILLKFNNHPSTNSSGADVAVVSVGGEADLWIPPGYSWSWGFVKCADVDCS